MGQNIKPLVSVLMPVYNGQRYLATSIKSILYQTYKNFEFIIIDDGSIDNSLEVINSFNDPRIKVIKNESNMGLPASLNKGINLAAGKYIIRMDADDISLPWRISKQVQFMEENKNVDISGSWILLFGTKFVRWISYTSHEDIINGMLFQNTLFHPSLILRRDKLVSLGEYYDVNYKKGQDYEYWTRLVSKGVKFSNIPQVLLLYRFHDNNLSKRKFKDHENKRLLIRKKYMEMLGFNFDERILDAISLIVNPIGLTLHDLHRIDVFLTKLLGAESESLSLLEVSRNRELGRRWFTACYNAKEKGMILWETYKTSGLFDKYNPPCKKRIIFWIKCVLKV